jgi:putative membrane-bound dehydrogenase-like protein
MKAPLASLALLSAFSLTAAEYKLHQFTKTQLDIHFWAEGANFGDFNRDGKMDIVAGPYWYAGPDFKKRHEYYPATRTFKLKPADGSEKEVPGFEGGLGKHNAYSDNFFAFAHDFNGDGWDDILILGFPGAESFWYENPKGASGHWKRHLALDVTDNESPTFVDLTGDGKPEIVANSKGFYGYAKPDPANPTAPFKWHSITPNNNYHKFTHGMGFGDVNGDGRTDILEKNGWWEQPASLAGDPVWKFHEFMFSPGGGAQMYAYDVNGDGLNDVITSLAAHGYGLAWYEQVREGDKITFKAHTFMNKELDENKYGVAFSQLHAIDLVDMDGDGLKDIVTGKRFWAHGATGDPEPNAPAVIYWFKLVREPGGGVDWVPQLIDNDSGVGTQVVARDITGDGYPEIVVSNKKGTFFHAHTVKKVSQEAWRAAQPKPYVKPPDAAAKGIVPTANGGRELNLGFENGDLRDWTAEGNAFEGQPIKGDTVAPRRGDMKSRHTGQYWIGTFEKGGDDLTGTLTSATFKVSHPWASFLVAGGTWDKTRVELVRADTGKAFFVARGTESEELRPVVADLKEHVGRDMFIRIVDQQQGHWGHINFDDFRFFAQRPEFANELTVAELKQQELPDIDAVKYAGLPADRAAEVAEMPPGFKMHAFAAEPDVTQPIAFCLDDRGRVWVAEGHNYPKKGAPGQGKDRILVFEDTNGDHKFDKRTVFMENLNLISGLEVGFGGVWVGAAPEFMFIPVNDWENPKPAGQPQVLLDGWDEKVDTHETLNTFMWGPDGWLYGVHGVFCPSHVGKPGTPKEDRQRVDAAVWRYHPQKHEFEVFAEGTSNPWGIDFNEHGHFFIEACVIPHFWHIIQGARYQRQGGQHYAITVEEMKRVQKHLAPNAPQYINPFIYDDIKSHGDHVHYAGNKGPHAANNRSDEAGGGHAHSGLMIYLGGSWPDEYRGKAFMNNIHGQRLNMDIPVRDGSGYIGKHGPDFLNFQDRWSQVLNLLYDQDGSVFMIDWYDANQCHHNREDGHDRSNGRIYKVVYNDRPVTRIDLQKNSNAELVELQLSNNDFLARHARRILQERGGDAATTAGLQKILRENPEVTRQLRALWTLHATRKLTEADLLGLLAHESEHLRSWAIQLLCEDRNPGAKALQEFARLVRDDRSAMVRLYLASAMQRTPIAQRLPVLKALVAKGGDAGDHNLPLMYWYAMEPVVGNMSGAGLELLTSSQIPLLRQYITRRLTTESLAGVR